MLFPSSECIHVRDLLQILLVSLEQNLERACPSTDTEPPLCTAPRFYQTGPAGCR